MGIVSFSDKNQTHLVFFSQRSPILKAHLQCRRLMPQESSPSRQVSFSSTFTIQGAPTSACWDTTWCGQAAATIVFRGLVPPPSPTSLPIPTRQQAKSFVSAVEVHGPKLSSLKLTAAAATLTKSHSVSNLLSPTPHPNLPSPHSPSAQTHYHLHQRPPNPLSPPHAVPREFRCG